MTKITSTYDGPLSLSGGVIIPPRGSADVENWSEVSKGEVVKTWLNKGILVVGDVKNTLTNEDGDSPEMAELRKQFDTAYAIRGQEIESLNATIAERDATIADLEAKLSAGGGQGGSTSSTPNTTGQNAGPAYALKDKGAGWFIVTVDGKDATKSLRKDDVEGFDAKSDEDKAAFVAENKAG